MRYEQLTAKEALESYCDWLLTLRTEDEDGSFFNVRRLDGSKLLEWYIIFYPLRTLLLAGKLLNKPEYTNVVFKYFDNYVDEQLPNGAFTSNYRNQPTTQLSKKEFHEILRCGKVNLADNGTNTQALVQAAMMCDNPARKERYLNAVRRWLDEWVPIWALPSGAYGNGIWCGHKLNGPYTIAMNVCSAFSSYALASGDIDYMENAESFIRFQCSRWLSDGRPIRMDCYPVLSENSVVEDFSRIFYIMEAMCWTHYASQNAEVRSMIEEKLKLWLFGEQGILSQWPLDRLWFAIAPTEIPPDMTSSRSGIEATWELAKSAGIPYLFSYYLNHIEDSPELRDYLKRGEKFLSHPLKARYCCVGVAPDEPSGIYALQAAGFAGLSLAEMVSPGCVFHSVHKSH